MKKLLLLLLSTLLFACNEQLVKDENSPFYSVTKGALLTLNQPITIQLNHASAILQDGKVTNEKQLDIYAPNCKFELETVGETERIVQADSFTIYKVKNDELVASLNNLKLANLWLATAGSETNYTTTFFLKSEKQPQVTRMACTHYGEASDYEYLSIKEMRQAMGSIFTLKLVE